MLRQNFLLLLFIISLVFNVHTTINPTVESCIEDGSDNIGTFKKIKSDGQCRQPFEVKFIAGRGSNYKIYTKMIVEPIDGSIIRYSFGTCKLELKAFHQNGKVWFEPLGLGPNSKKQIAPGFYIHLYEPIPPLTDTMQVMRQEDDFLYYGEIDCDIFSGFGNGKTMDFKQEIEIGAPNIALILYKDSNYFGRADVESSQFIGDLPPYPSTTTPFVPSTSIASSSTKPSSSTTKHSSSSTQAISSTSSSFNVSSTAATILSETATEEKGMKPWLIGVIAGVSALILIIIVIITVICVIRHCKEKEKSQVVDVFFNTGNETKTRDSIHGRKTKKTKEKSKEHSKSISKSLFGSIEKSDMN